MLEQEGECLLLWNFVIFLSSYENQCTCSRDNVRQLLHELIMPLGATLCDMQNDSFNAMTKGNESYSVTELLCIKLWCTANVLTKWCHLWHRQFYLTFLFCYYTSSTQQYEFNIYTNVPGCFYVHGWWLVWADKDLWIVWCTVYVWVFLQLRKCVFCSYKTHHATLIALDWNCSTITTADITNVTEYLLKTVISVVNIIDLTK